MLDVTNMQGSANQNDKEISLYTHCDGYFKKQQKDVEKLKHLCMVGGSVKWCRFFEKHYDSSSKNKIAI